MKYKTMKSLSLLTLMILGLVFFQSCGTEIDPYQNTSNDLEYFPIEVGNTWIYSLDSIVFDNKGAIVDSIHNTVREVIIKSYEDNEGETAFVVERSNKDGDNWIVSDIWSMSINNSQAIRTEDNIRFIKMSFPIEKNKSWDGNAYIDTQNLIVKIAGESIKMYENWLYRYLEIGTSESIGLNTYNDLVVIQQVDNENAIQKRYSVEKYERNIGLVYKRMMILNTQQTDISIPWKDKAEEGFILEQTLISFKK